MCTLDSVNPAALDRDETKRFRSILTELPESILSNDSVEEARRKERDSQDDRDDDQIDTQDGVAEPGDANPVNGMLRILKNNKIMGQVLRNKHGNLEKSKIEEIIGIISDSGLRLVNLILKDEDEIASLAHYIKSKYPDWDMPRIKYELEWLSFIWTMVNIEQIVYAVNVPEIREAVDTVVSQGSTPAYDLIGYFNQLDSVEGLTQAERNKLQQLLKKHDDTFIKRVLSIRTQHYMNTHRSSKASVEQSISALLGLKYRPRIFPRA